MIACVEVYWLQSVLFRLVVQVLEDDGAGLGVGKIERVSSFVRSSSAVSARFGWLEAGQGSHGIVVCSCKKVHVVDACVKEHEQIDAQKWGWAGSHSLLSIMGRRSRDHSTYMADHNITQE